MKINYALPCLFFLLNMLFFLKKKNQVEKKKLTGLRSKHHTALQESSTTIACLSQLPTIIVT